MVTDFAQQRGFTRRLVFIEDFDLTADRALSQGVDLWLNTPRRPLEACGIGGMKAGVNGALNLSTLDGWWDEAWNDAMPGAPPIGWCIGTADTFEDHDLQDELDAESLYDQLEHDIVPRFYDRDDARHPPPLARVGPPVDGDARRDVALAPDGRAVRGRPLPPERAPRRSPPDQRRDARATARGHARARVERAWPQVRVEVATCTESDGATTTVDLHASLGELSSRDVTVDLWVLPPEAPPYPVAAHYLVGPVGPGATVAYRARRARRRRARASPPACSPSSRTHRAGSSPG